MAAMRAGQWRLGVLTALAIGGMGCGGHEESPSPPTDADGPDVLSLTLRPEPGCNAMAGDYEFFGFITGHLDRAKRNFRILHTDVSTSVYRGFELQMRNLREPFKEGAVSYLTSDYLANSYFSYVQQSAGGDVRAWISERGGIDVADYDDLNNFALLSLGPIHLIPDPHVKGNRATGNLVIDGSVSAEVVTP